MTYDRTEQSDKIVEKFDTTNSVSDLESHNPPEHVSQIGERHYNILQYEERDKLPLTVGPTQSYSSPSSNKETKHEGSEQSEETVQDIRDEIGEELDTTKLTVDLESCNPQGFSSPLGERHDHDESVEGNQRHDNVEMSKGTLRTECITPGSLPEVDEVMHGHYQFNLAELEINEPSVIEEEEDDDVWNNFTRIESGEGVDVNLNENEHESYQETVRSDFQESHEEWFDNDNFLEDTEESWYGGTSYLEAALLDRSITVNASDDDNGRRVELRELTSR